MNRATSAQWKIRTNGSHTRTIPLTWEIDIDDGLTIAVDLDDLNDVLGNLMENAARCAHARVRISAERDGRMVRLSVADDGDTVDPQRIAAVTSRGKRLDESGGGAGLGLAIVGEILEAYDSDACFSSSDLGGLQVGFSLPAANP